MRGLQIILAELRQNFRYWLYLIVFLLLLSQTPNLDAFLRECFDAYRVLMRTVFCLDPIIRDNSDVALKNAIVVLDEAHNVEDVCREAVSFSFNEKEIVTACMEFRKKGLASLRFLNAFTKTIDNTFCLCGGHVSFFCLVERSD